MLLQSLIFLPQPPSSAVGTACSRLSWPTVLPGRPHGPIILASLACLSLYPPTPPVIFQRRQPNQSTLVLSTAWAATAVSSPAPCLSLRRPRRRPPPWCSRRDLVNMVNDRHASEVDCTWRGRQLGPRPHARKCLLITRKIMIPPPDIWDPPEGPLYFAKKSSLR